MPGRSAFDMEEPVKKAKVWHQDAVVLGALRVVVLILTW
jgi:hypothetical protein